MLRSVVVLPAPLRPSRATTSPSLTLERKAMEDMAQPVERIHIFQFQDQAATPPR